MKIGDTVQLIEDKWLGELYPWKKDTDYTVTSISDNYVRSLDGIQCCFIYTRFRIMKTLIERIQELAKELKTKYPEAFGTIWRIKIDDSYNIQSYVIKGRDDVSIHEVAKTAARFLKGTIVESSGCLRA